MPKYDAEYFIEKFEGIPDEQWCCHEFVNPKGQKCALGHCGEDRGRRTTEGSALSAMFKGGGNVTHINNGESVSYNQETPRARILAAIRQIRTTEKEDGR